MKLIWMIRSIFFAIGQISTLIFFSVFGQLLRPFSHATRYRFMHYWARFCIWWLKVTCGLSYRVHGAENIDKGQAGLILARHESAWETLVFQSIFPRQTFVLKKELLRIPFFGWGLEMMHPISIDRGDGRKAMKQVITEGVQRLKDGIWVVLFPEGTRIDAGKQAKIKAGGAMLAQKTDAPVYLVGHNAGEFWPKNGFIKRPGVIDVYISEPLQLSDKTVTEINQLIEEWFLSHSSIRQEVELESDS